VTPRPPPEGSGRRAVRYRLQPPGGGLAYMHGWQGPDGHEWRGGPEGHGGGDGSPST
jgi:hypothetical protein